MENAKFLLPYRSRAADPGLCLAVLRAAGGGPETIGGIVAKAAGERERGRWLNCLWHLLATGRLIADLGCALDMDSAWRRQGAERWRMPGKVSSYRKGTVCRVVGRVCTIRQAIAADRVLVRFKDTGDVEEVSVADIRPLEDEAAEASRPVDALTETEFEEAQRRRSLVKDLASLSSRERGVRIKAICEGNGISRSTLYRWLRASKQGGHLSALAPQRAKVRKKRLSRKVEAVIFGVIEAAYLTPQRISGAKLVDLVGMKCRAAHLKAPSEKAVRQRLGEIDARRRMKMREGKKAARDRYDEVKESFPGAEYPLNVVQIDHTRLDIEVVDDEHRMPIGRPWLTLAMDVCSRMVTGLYLSLDAPSAFSVGMCIRHSVLEKDAELGRLGVEGRWAGMGDDEDPPRRQRQGFPQRTPPEGMRTARCEPGVAAGAVRRRTTAGISNGSSARSRRRYMPFRGRPSPTSRNGGNTSRAKRR